MKLEIKNPKQLQQPYRITRAELEAAGYNADNHPAYELNVARRLRQERMGIDPNAQPTDRALELGVDAADTVLSHMMVDGTSGVVMLPEEVAAGDRAVETVSH